MGTDRSTPGVGDRSDNGLSAFMHMDVLHFHLLLAAATELCQGL